MPSQPDLEDVKMSIRATLIANPSPRITIRSLGEQYKLLEDEEIPFRQFDCYSLHEFLLKIPDTVKLLNERDRNSYVEPVVTEKTRHVDRLVRCQNKKKPKKNTDFKARRPSFRVYPPISNYPTYSQVIRNEKSVQDNSLANELPPIEKDIPLKLVCRLVKLLRTNEYIKSGNLFEEYEKLYHQKLRPESFGFASKETLLEYLESTFSDVGMDQVDSGHSSSSSPSGDVCVITDCEPFISEVCGSDFTLKTDPAFERLDRGDRFAVALGEVFSLDQFYITLRSKVTLLDSMMWDLDRFYKNDDEKYKIPISSVSTNLLCVCPYSENSQWHRTRVVSHSPSLRTAKVVFIDYGTTEIVSVHKLRYLHKRFAECPPFCMEARLSGIRPIGTSLGYGDRANLEFLQRYGNRNDLEAEVVRKTSNCLEILLYTSEGGRRTAVHEELISKDLVLPTSEELMVNGTTISKVIEEIMSRLSVKSKSSFVSPEAPPAVVPTPKISSSRTVLPPPPPMRTMSSFPKQAPVPAYMYYPPQVWDSRSFPSSGTYTGFPLIVPNPSRPPYPLVTQPIQNPAYVPPCQPFLLPIIPSHQHRNRLNSFRPPPGLTLPSLSPHPWSAPNLLYTPPFTKFPTDMPSATVNSQGSVQSTLSRASGGIYSSYISYDVPNSLVNDKTEELVDDIASLHRSCTIEEIIAKDAEKIPICEEQEEDDSYLPEGDEQRNELRQDGLHAEKEKEISMFLRVRHEMEKKLEDYLELDGGEDGEDEVKSVCSESPSPTKLNVLAREFTPITNPRTSSVTTTDTNIPCATIPKNLPSTKDTGTSEKLNQLRAFVRQHQVKM